MSKKKSMSRRSFIGKSAAGLSSVAFSSALMEMLLSSTGCKSGPGGASGASDLILPEDILAKAVSHLMSKGADFGDVYVERAAMDSVMSDDRKINTTTTIEKGVGLRAVKGGRTFYAYTGSFEPERVYETARYVADAAAAPASASAPSTQPMTGARPPACLWKWRTASRRSLIRRPLPGSGALSLLISPGSANSGTLQIGRPSSGNSTCAPRSAASR